MKRFSRLSFILLSILLLGTFFFPAQTVTAHGGFVIDSGEVDNYEWAASIFPYPVPVGATVLSILLFDKTNGTPAMDLTGEVYLAEPGDTRPCCQPGVHRGPFPLTSDQKLYPGDYTTFIPVDIAGRWQVLFKMKSSTGEYGVVTGFDAVPYGDGSQPVDKPAIATQVAIAFSAAATASAQSAGSGDASVAAQPGSPLAQAASPLAQPAAQIVQSTTLSSTAPVADNVTTTQPGSNRTLLLVGGLGLVVVLGVVAMMMMGGRKSE
ncbi:MAG: hypothetical protein U0175_29425 [Caldilineaceae bacterium]